MIKTILADNELWVCKLIENLVDWEALGFKISDVAYSGDELYELVKLNHPDLIITDIQMSGMTGIEVLEKLHQENINIPAIIVSGYDDFNYAQKAIDLNVFSYLLKPLDEETLKNLLIKFKNKMHFSNYNINILEQQLDVLKQQYFHIYLKGLLSGESEYMTFSEINFQFKSHFKPGSFRVILLALDPKIPGKKPDEKSYLYVTEVIQNTLKPIIYEFSHIRTYPYWILLINYQSDNENLIRAALENLVSTENNSLPNILISSHITLGMGEPINNLADIRFSYTTALNSIHSRLVVNTDKVIYLNSSTMASNSFLSIYVKNLISSYINSYASSETSDSLTEAIINLYKSDMAPYALFDLVKSGITYAILSLPTPPRKNSRI